MPGHRPRSDVLERPGHPLALTQDRGGAVDPGVVQDPIVVAGLRDVHVQLVGRALGRGVALALLGDAVNQHRLVAERLGVLEHTDQGVHVVAVDRADIVEAELFEEGAAGDHAAGVLFRLAGGLVQRGAPAEPRGIRV